MRLRIGIGLVEPSCNEEPSEGRLSISMHNESVTVSLINPNEFFWYALQFLFFFFAVSLKV